MALHTKNGSYDIPKDAIQLSRDDAVEFMHNILRNWKTPSEVFYIKYGAGILGGVAALSGLYFNNYYRTCMRLQSFARMSTYLPAVVVPSTAAFLMHAKKVQEPIVVMEAQCSVCMEIRSTCWQLFTGFLYPLALSPLSSFMMALRYHTYNVPQITSDPKSVWRLFVKLTRPIKTSLVVIASAHIITSAFITYKEAESVAIVSSKLAEFEVETEESGVSLL